MPKIYVQDGFEKPSFFRFKHRLMSIASSLAKFGSRLNIGTDASNFRKIMNKFSKMAKTTNKNVKVENTTINGVKVRIYYPKNSMDAPNKPMMIYYHGGAYVFGDLDTFDAYLYEFVVRLNMVVISVDYRMAPEHPFPAPTNDCYTVTCFAFENATRFGCDPNKIILGGDSAGGNATAVITQRLLKENKPQPKLQLLIYPWVQMLNNKLPSSFYTGKDLISSTKQSHVSAVSMYLGFKKFDRQIEDLILSNGHMGLIEDKTLAKYKSYFDTDKINASYKEGKKYYEMYEKDQQVMYPVLTEETRNQLIKKDPQVEPFVKRLCDPAVSPLLADTEDLKGVAEAYFIVFEWDVIKDDGLLYAERLKEAGVPVKMAFYEKGFHGIVSLVNKRMGYQIARNVQEDLINFLKIKL